MRKIIDLVSLRAEALRLAVDADVFSGYTKTPNGIISTAKAFELYIKGEADMPEIAIVPDAVNNVHICNGCGEEYDDEDEIGLN